MSVGYGRDTSCSTKLVAGRYATGTRLIAEALLRRYRTPRGVLIPVDFDSDEEEPNYGLDVAGFIGMTGLERASVILPSMMRGEALKDDRIADVNITATIVTDSRGRASIEFSLDVSPSENLDDFQLTLTADEAAVSFSGGVF